MLNTIVYREELCAGEWYDLLPRGATGQLQHRVCSMEGGRLVKAYCKCEVERQGVTLWVGVVAEIEKWPNITF